MVGGVEAKGLKEGVGLIIALDILTDEITENYIKKEIKEKKN